MPQIDLRPAADQMARLLEAVPDDALDAPTPCADTRLAVLIEHVGGFAQAFTAAAGKNLGPLTSSPPTPGSGDLEPGWRARIAGQLTDLADAWTAADAWEGTTQAGGVDLPADMAGRVALDELVVHGWDVARAVGQPFSCGEDSLLEVEATVGGLRGEHTGDIPGLFGPVVPVPADAPALDRVLGLTGRDPAWSPPG